MATLDELEGQEWLAPSAGATRLVRRCFELRGKDIGDMTNEDLRILIGQHIGLRWLVPVAVERLEAEPLAAGDLYAGDLLASLLGVPESFWVTDTAAWLRLRGLAELVATAGEQAAAWLARTRGGA